MPKNLWPEAVNYANFIKNRAPTKALERTTPFEAFWGHKPSAAHLQEFGAPCWVLRQDNHRTKLDMRSRDFKFVGFSEESCAHRYYNGRAVLTSRNVAFGVSPDTVTDTVDSSGLPAEGEPLVPPIQPTPPALSPATSPAAVPATPARQLPPPTVPSAPISPIADPALPERPTPCLHLRVQLRPNYVLVNNPNSRLSQHQARNEWAPAQLHRQGTAPEDEETAMIATPEPATEDPWTHEEALARPDAAEWHVAMDAKIAQHMQRGTWTLVDCPPDRRPLNCKWVLITKHDAEGNPIKKKRRLVVKGFTQIPGIDFDQTFTPVVRMETLRILIALATITHADIQTVDVVGAYLNGRLEEAIYMRQPLGYDDGMQRVCLLALALYGLKQAGRVWHEHVKRTFTELGFTQLISDQWVFIRAEGEHFWWVAIWVDDMLIISSSPNDTVEFKTAFAAKYTISDLGPIRQIVGLEVQRTDKTTLITQRAYINRILARYGMADANPVHTPLGHNVILDKHAGAIDSVLRTRYQQMIGALMYAALGCRFDIAHTVQHLSQFSSNPMPEHLTAVKHVYRYLKATRDLRLTYRANGQIEFDAYADADWANDRTDRKSVTDQVMILANGPVTWAAHKQRRVAKSSTEAEYVAASSASAEIVWLRSLLAELGFQYDAPTPLFLDNRGAIATALAQVNHSRTKHIDIHHHYIRDHVADKTIKVIHVPSNDNLADLFTKALPRLRFDFLCQLLHNSN